MQTRLESFLETCVNIATGFIISMFVWQCIAAPLYHIEVTIQQNLGITSIFTVSAIIRGYFWRRFFSNKIHKRVHAWLVEK